MRSSAGVLPLAEDEAPDIAENNDESHVDGPTGKVVLSHFGRAHSIEHKLQIPRGPGQSREDIIASQ